MSPHPDILRILRESQSECADHALLAALPMVDPSVQRSCVRLLIERGRPAGVNGLPPGFHKLATEARVLILANTTRLFGALRACIRSSNGQTRTNTLDIVRNSANPRLAYLAASALHDGSPKVRAEAGQTLLTLAEDHCHKFDTTSQSLREVVGADARLAAPVTKTLELLREERGHLVDALREALEHYESHHRGEVVQAAMLMACELEASLFPANTIKRGKLTHAMVEILSEAPAPRLVPFVYIALAYPELRRRLVPLLQGCRDAAFMTAFVRHFWLAGDPNVRRHLSAIRSVAWLDEGFEAAFSVAPDIAWRMPAWLMSLGLPSTRKVAILMDLLIVDNRQANRAAAWALVDMPGPEATLALQGLIGHEDLQLEQIARMELERRTSRQRRLASQLPALRGRPPAWSALLQEAGLSERFEDLWQHFERISPEHARAAGEHAFEYIKGFASSMQLRLASQQPAERVRALRMMAALGVCAQFEKDVFGACNDHVPEVRASAVTALGRVGGETSRRILERALNDSAPAVQSAAIEALDTMGARNRAELIRTKIASAHADVRAASVRSLLRLRRPEAARGLLALLRDERPEHRCAGLWVVDELGLTAIVEHIEAMSHDDGDVRIGRLAAHVGRRLRRRLESAGQRPGAAGGAGDADEAALTAVAAGGAA